MASLDTATPPILTVADLKAAPGLTDQYDDVLFKLCDTSLLIGNPADASTRICQHLRRATNADTVYFCNRTTLDLVATSSSNTTAHHCADTVSLHNALTSMISDLWNCTTPFCSPPIRAYPDEPKFSYTAIPNDRMLIVLVNADNSRLLASNYIAHAISVFFDIHQPLEGNTLSQVKCETAIFDALQSSYQNSSTRVITRRLELYQQLLKAGQLNFNNIFADKTEALHATLPDDFYTTAEIWGDDFKVTLDMHFLTEASHAYKALCENSELLQFSESRQLELKVFSTSLSDPTYLDALRELLEKSLVHTSRLQFHIRQKSTDDTTDYPEALNDLLREFGQVAGRKHSNKRKHNNKGEQKTYNVADDFFVPGAETTAPAIQSNKNNIGKSSKQS